MSLNSKKLNYLYLALNNICLIENLEGCESLKKLDMTANFIDLDDYELSMKNLKEVSSIRELYLTGNPISDFNKFLTKIIILFSWKHYREYAVAIVDQLDMLDGKEVTPSERIIAKQNLQDLTVDLYTKIEMKKIEKMNKKNEEKPIEKEENTKEDK